MTRLLLLGVLSVAVAFPAAAQIRLQVIHNSPDRDAGLVDVYINDDLALDNLAFRSATGFLDLPSDTDLVVEVAPANSTSSDDAISSTTFNLPIGSYQLVATGVLDPARFADNPDGIGTGFQLLPATNARENSPTGVAGVRVIHGSPDAPTVDVRTGGDVLVDDASYTDVTGYVEVPPSSYVLDVTTADGATTVASFQADLAGGDAVTVLASGFLDPSANNGGPSFGLLAVFPDGTSALLDSPATTARLQVIHNAADPAASVVDVYVNDDLLLDDFAFRTASPFIDVPGDTDLEVAVAPGTSMSSADALATFEYNLPIGSTTQLIANGVLDPSDFADNPDGEDIAFTLFVGGDAQEASGDDGEVAVRVVHGATDAPTVDVRSGGDVLVDDASYSDITGYLDLPADDYVLDVTTADGTAVASFAADLSGAGGGAVTVLASGFLTPGDNEDGPAFGLLAVFPNGDTALLEAPVTTARLQVIHNAADPAASVVDVYVNDDLLLDDFAFRTASPFIDVPADTELNVAVAPGTSASSADAIATFMYTLPEGSTTQLIANGVLDPSSFADNPDGENTGFTLLVGADAQEASDDDGEVAVRVVHGATDAPTVDVRSGGSVLVDDASYSDITGYLDLPADAYTLDVTTADGTPVASFAADLSGAGGGAVTVLASGFLSPDDDQDGPAFGLLAVFPDGTAALLPAGGVATDGAPDAETLALATPAPNPVVGRAAVSFSLDVAGRARLALYDALGREVAVLADGEFPADRVDVALDATRLAAGAYVLRLQTATGAVARTLTVLR